jgi:hypothetical protein
MDLELVGDDLETAAEFDWMVKRAVSGERRKDEPVVSGRYSAQE